MLRQVIKPTGQDFCEFEVNDDADCGQNHQHGGHDADTPKGVCGVILEAVFEIHALQVN